MSKAKVSCRGVVSTGPLARGHLIWPPGHLLLDSTGPDWPPKFKPYLLKKIINQLFCKNTQSKQFVNLNDGTRVESVCEILV